MNINELTSEINRLSACESEGIFKDDVLNSEEYLKMIYRLNELHILRDHYFNRAVLHKKDKNYEKAVLDFYESAKLEHPAAKTWFTVFKADFLAVLYKSVQIPDNLTADQAFTLFLMHSTGVGKNENQVAALFNLKCAAVLGHPAAKNLCDPSTIEMIQLCILHAKKQGSILIPLMLDNATGIIGKYYQTHQFEGTAFPLLAASAHAGSGHGFHGLGNLFFDNKAYPADYFKSFRLFSIAAQAGAISELREDAYIALAKMAESAPEKTIQLLDDISHSRIVAFRDFYVHLSKMLKKPSFSFWSKQSHFTPDVINKMHEILALCEITQYPCIAHAGLSHMEQITDVSSCSPFISEKLVQFHRNFPGRIDIDKDLHDLLFPFGQIAMEEKIPAKGQHTYTMESL